MLPVPIPKSIKYCENGWNIKKAKKAPAAKKKKAAKKAERQNRKKSRR